MTDQDVPDIFVDGVGVDSGPYGVMVTLYRSNPRTDPGTPGETVGRIRLNLELADDLMLMLKDVVTGQRKLNRQRLQERRAKVRGENKE